MPKNNFCLYCRRMFVLRPNLVSFRMVCTTAKKFRNQRITIKILFPRNHCHKIKQCIWPSITTKYFFRSIVNKTERFFILIFLQYQLSFLLCYVIKKLLLFTFPIERIFSQDSSIEILIVPLKQFRNKPSILHIAIWYLY